NGARGNPRLLAVSSECELTLYELEAEGPTSGPLVSASEFTAEKLLQLVVSLRLLSFVDARSFLLLNSSVVVQLQWQQGAEPDTLSCCSIVLPPKAPLDTCTDYQLCRGILFVLTTAGVIYVFDSAEGRKLASVDLPSYHTAGLGEDEPAPYLDSFCLLQVSPDLGTAVAATQSNTAFAVDLNHYFRYFSSKQGRTITETHQDGLLVIQSVQSIWISHNWSFLDSLLPFSLALSQKHSWRTSLVPPLLLCVAASGLSLVLFAVSQEELLNRLMVFGSAGTVDSLCHLNEWGRCAIPIHALQAGLKNHQLDTVDFFLKSKKNVLTPPSGYILPDQSAAISTQSQLKNVQDLCPALDLLRCAIRDNHTEAQSRQFSEQLLSITLAFLNTQVRAVLSATEELDENLQECVEILDSYVSDLRTFMKRFPWPTGGDTSTLVPSPIPVTEEVENDYWSSLSSEEVVERAVLTRQIPRAQAYLRSQNRPDQRLEELRSTGLRLAFNCLTHKDLEQATALLRNMVRLWLCSVEELSKQSYLSDEETQRVEFIKQIEALCAVPETRCTDPVGRQRYEIKRYHLFTAFGFSVLSSCAFLLSGFLTLSCDPGVLWSYLTSHHDQRRVTEWIESLAAQNGDPSSAPQWPALTAEVVNNNTRCSAHMRNHILYMLARRGVFIQAEMADFEQLLWRLGQAGGVMQASPPIPQYRSPQGHDLHTRFIHHCLDNGLRYLLYTYLEHNRLTPRNCPALADNGLYESHPWFEMLVKMQEITRDLSDPERVFQASLTSAQVLIPGSQAMVSSMLLEGHSLLALATIMFAPGGIDQVVSQGERAGSSVSRVDPQLLKMALSPYPKLKAALFPVSGPRGTTATTSDISVYHLMQSLHPLDPSRLFGWQSANTLGSTVELPHFSSPHLVSKYALIENLDFLYYLRHGRPSFAYGTFLVQQLANSNEVKSQLSHAAQQAYSLAMLHFSVPSVAAACVCFCELLGVCSLKLRVDLKALSLILRLRTQRPGGTTAKGSKLVERETAEELLFDLEEAVKDSLKRKGTSQEWALPIQFCQLHALPLSSVYPQDCAADSQWLHFLLFVQLHTYPPQQVRSLVTQFSPALQAHLTLAFQNLQLSSQWRVGEVEDREAQGQVTLPSEEASDPPKELFQVLLQSQEQASPWRHLLGEALAQHCPTLTILAACHQVGLSDLLQCLCVWVLTSVDEVIATEATAHLEESPQRHEWNLHDLSIIWKTLLRKCRIRPLIRGFQLFQRDSPLIHVLLMYELCYDYKNYPEAKKKLIEFQKCLITVTTRTGPIYRWVECQASVLLLTMMQQCSTQYELRRLLQLLADMERLLKSNGPDFKKLSFLSQVLQDTSVSLSPRLLESYSPDILQGECQNMLEKLQDSGLFHKARQVAELAGLPIDSLVINELLQDLGALKAKRHWERRETRVSFWRKCHEQFRTNSTGPGAASEFFLAQAGASEPPRGSVAGTELLCVQERCLLLSLAGYWLSWLAQAPLARLEDLEKQLWTSRVRQQVLLTAMEKESMFALPAPTIAPEENSYEALIREFSFSKMAVLNEPRYLSLDGLPSFSPEEEGGEKTGLEEQGALAILVGQLLDEGCIHEASRVCRYFSFCSRDMWVVLHCRGLASGELQAGLQDMLTFEGLPKKSIPSCKLHTTLTVELLILAHDCFSLTCNMEGIVRVLQAARHLSHAHLAHSEHYGLLVRLLTGIGRYNDMTYIFDLLNQNHRFEMLLRKKVESNFRLKTALLDYIKRCLPGDSEKYNMVALCFSMCREIGENHEGAARTQLKLIESQPWGESALIKVLTLLKDAAESYSKDSCVRQAARCVKMAKLTTLQLHFLNHGQDQRVINLRQSDLLGAIVALPRCYQAFVLSEAYDYSPDWAEVLYQKVILSGDFAYLEEFRLHRPLPACLFEDISQKLTHNTPPSSAGQNLKRLLQHCDDVYTYYKLAYEHKFFDVANMLLQDSKTSSYLNDRLGTR
uniref:Spatacsin C-terminal domain-containing protein n=1 Tax=Oncorhynchus tshawytscha TaxID=74940 RepID=A0AAZ3RB95_ONCTS